MVAMRFLSHLVVLLLLVGCKPEPRPEIRRLYFEVPLNVRPVAQSITLGDTLWIEADYPDSLLEIRSQQRYRIRPQDAPIETVISFYQLTGAVERQRGFASAFTLVNKIGSISNLGSTAGFFETIHAGNIYRAKCGLVAMKRGIASITIYFSSNKMNSFRPGSSIPFIELGKNQEGGKIIAELGDIYYVINKGNTNFDLLRQHAKAYSLEPNAPEPAIYYEQKSTFNVIIQ